MTKILLSDEKILSAVLGCEDKCTENPTKNNNRKIFLKSFIMIVFRIKG